MGSQGKDWYRKQLSTPEWKSKRKEIYERDQYRCVDCSRTGVTIHCHHLHYVKGKLPWEYDAEYLETVCEECHENRHKSPTMKFDSPKAADQWYMFAEAEREMLRLELLDRRKRIDKLEDLGAVFDYQNRYWSLVDANGKSLFYDENGEPL